MDSFNNKIKNELSNYDSEIPSGMSWEEMGPAILSKMEKKERKYGFWWFLSGFSFVLIATMIYWIYDPALDLEQEQFQIARFSNIEKNPISEKKQEETNTNQELSRNNLTIKSSADKFAQLSAEPMVNHNVKQNSIIEDLKDSASRPMGTLATSNHKDQVNERFSIDNPLAIKEKIDEVRLKLISNTKDKSLEDFSRLARVNDELLELKNLALFVNDNNLLVPAKMNLSNIDESNTKKIKVNISTLIGAEMGAFAWNWNHNSNSYIDISDYEKTRISISGGLRYALNVGKYVSLQSGVYYSQYKSLFENIFEHSYQEYSDNHTSHVHNLLTGRTTAVNPGLVEVVEKQHVLHTNKLHTLSVPLVAKVNFQLNNWALQIGPGVSTSYLFNIQGRSVNKDLNLIEYKELERKQQFGFSTLIEANLMYEFKEDLFMSLGTHYERGLSSWTIGDNTISRSPSSYGVRLGIFKKI